MVGSNQLGGDIPLFPKDSDKPYYIDLSDNQFTGTIPPALMGLPSLEFLYLDRNSLTGPIPYNFGNSTSLIGT